MTDDAHAPSRGSADSPGGDDHVDVTGSLDEPSSRRIDLRIGLIASILGLVATVAISVYGWLNTEAGQQVAVHFGPDGQPDRWGSRLEAFGVMPAVLAGVTVLLAVLPRIDPRRSGIAKSMRAYNLVWAAVVVFLAVVHLMATRSAVSETDSGINARLLVVVLGVLYLVIGNYLPKTGSNWFFGIRTPWTLSDERVWTATHRLGGRLFMVSGLLTLVAAVVVPDSVAIGLVVAMAIVTAVVTMVYSYVLYRRLNPPIDA